MGKFLGDEHGLEAMEEGGEYSSPLTSTSSFPSSRGSKRDEDTSTRGRISVSVRRTIGASVGHYQISDECQGEMLTLYFVDENRNPI